LNLKGYKQKRKGEVCLKQPATELEDGDGNT
jgi:hypothetical protein